MTTVPNPAAEVVKLDLSAGSVHTTMLADKPHVVIRPAVEALGLSYPAQYRKLQTRSWAVVAQKATTGADGKTYEMDIVPVRTFLMLLATIHENKVAPAARPVLIAYQNETADAIEAYWTKGVASNPRGAPEPATTISWDQAAAIARLQYGFDIDTAGLRDLLSKGGILTKDLRPHRKWEHLFWPLANRWEIHAYVLPQLIRYAVTVRRQLAAAEEDLQLSLPLPMSGLLMEAPMEVARPAALADVLNLPRQMRGDAS